MHTKLVSIFLAFSIGFCIICDMSYASPFPCRRCRSEEECNEAPANYCPWGESRDSCDRRVCSKGPGERCGGAQNVLGHCGDGMLCIEERCSGCSVQTMECYHRN